MDNYITITGREYRKLILDSELLKEREELSKERMRLDKEREDNIKFLDTVEENTERRFKYSIEKKDRYIGELLTKIKKYESNWFVKLFLNDDNNKKPKFPWS